MMGPGPVRAAGFPGNCLSVRFCTSIPSVRLASPSQAAQADSALRVEGEAQAGTMIPGLPAGRGRRRRPGPGAAGPF
jgi:hypothetical protein